MKSMLQKILCWTAVILVSAGTVNAMVVYQDNFNNAGTTALRNRPIDLVTYDDTWGAPTGIVKWPDYDGVATYSILDNGSIKTNITQKSGSIFLPVNISSGYVYRYTVSYELTDGMFLICFNSGNPGQNVSPSYLTSVGNFAVGTWGGGAVVAQDGSGNTITNATGMGTSNTLTLELDTTDSDWVLNFLVNGTAFGTYTYTGAPSVAGISFGYAHSTVLSDGEFTSLQVEATEAQEAPVFEETVYQDDLNGSATTALRNVPIDQITYDSTWGAPTNVIKWADYDGIGSYNIRADGSIKTNSAQTSGSIYLPVNISPNYIYRYMLSYDMTASQLFMCLNSSNPGDNVNPASTAVADFLLGTWNDGVVIAEIGATQIANLTGMGTNNTLMLELDTRESNWVVNFFVNDTEYASYTFTNETTVSGISFGYANSTLPQGQFSAFQLDVLATALNPQPAIISIATANGSATFSVGNLSGSPLVTNTVQTTDDLASGTWSNLFSIIGTSETNWTFPMDLAQGFFRIQTTY